MATRLPAPRRKRQLLDVALQCFAERGYHGTAMDDIAEAAGVTKPVLYQHFGSKRSLYLELLEDAGAQLLEAIAQATGPAIGPRAQVAAGFAAYLEVVAARPQAFRLLFGSGARRDEEFADAVHRVELEIARTIGDLIAADIDDEQRMVLAHGIVGMAEGAVREQLHDGQVLDSDRLARQLADLAWGGLRGIRRV
jgi:AcrR family transcriptional regulator